MSREDAPRADDGAEGGRGRWDARPVIRSALAMLVLLALVLSWRALPVADWVDQRVVPRVERLGPWGFVAFAAVYVAAVVLMVPGTALTVSGGYLFGPIPGAAVSLGSATVGAALAFLVARRAARDHVRRRVEADRRFRAVDRAVADRGAWIVLLLRLTPIVPYNLSNYALGLTGVRFGSYVLATLVGMMPGTAAVSFVGASAGGWSPGSLGRGGWLAVVVSTLLAVAVIGWIAGRALMRAAGDDGPEGPRDTPCEDCNR